MFTFGSQVNPSLLRQDFSPILQAAQAQAQATQQAAAIRAQSLAQLGSTVAKGIETYTQNQEKKKQEAAATDMVAGIFKANPFLAKGFNLPTDQNGEFDKGALKEFIKVSGGPGQAVQLAQGLDQMNRAQQAQEDQRKAAQVAAYLQQGGGNLPSPVNRNAFTAEQLGAGRLAYTQMAQAEANLGKTRAETTALGIPKAPARLTPTQQYIDSGLRAYRLKYGAEPSAEEEQKIVSEAMEKGRAQTTIKTGDEVLTRSVFDTLKGGYDTAVAAQRALPAYAEARKLLAEGNVITGAGAEPRLALAKGLALFGISSDNVSNTEVLRAQLAQPVFALVKQLGSGSGISNADLDFSKKAAGGEIALDSKTIARLVDIGERASKLSIESYRDRLNRTYPKGKEEFSTARAVLELPDVIQPMPF